MGWAGLIFLLAAITDAWAAGNVSIMTFGRANQEAMETAYFEPFRRATGVKVDTDAYDGQTDEFKSLLKSGHPPWDVIQVESAELTIGCKQGWLQKLDHGRIAATRDAVKGATAECGAGIFAWSQAFVYDAGRLAGTPDSWADFWNVKQFPGKRGLRRSAKYTLEFALLADGVAPAALYSVLATAEGVDRAFRKLDQLKESIVWWEAAAQPSLFLDARRVVMSSAYTLWIDAARKRGKNWRIVWNQSLYDFDSWAMPKGAAHRDEGYRFIAFASKPENQKAFSEAIGYGPANSKALKMLKPEVARTLPTQSSNLNGAIRIDIPFWIAHGVQLEERFAAWAPPLNRQTTEEHEHPEPSVASPQNSLHDHRRDHKDATPHVH